MSFGENLQLIRNKYNITQEQLAEELDVTRQSVSKWESGVSYPEMNTILKICEMYQVSMDDLMRGVLMEKDEEVQNRFEKHIKGFARKIAGSVGTIIAAVSLGDLLDELGMPENIAGMIFMLFVVLAIIVIIVAGMDHDRFTKKYPVMQQYHTEAEIEKFDGKFIRMIAGSIGTILIGVVVLIGFDATQYEDIAGCGFLFLVAAAVTVLILAGMQREIYYVEEYNKSNRPKKEDKKIGAVCGCIMLIATIIFILWGFLGSYDGDLNGQSDWIGSHSGWAISWLAYPVGGILCAIAALILKQKYEDTEDEKENEEK